MEKRNKKTGFNFSGKLREQDKFGVQVSLNFGGEDSIKSIPGAVISLILTVLMIAYAIKQG